MATQRPAWFRLPPSPGPTPAPAPAPVRPAVPMRPPSQPPTAPGSPPAQPKPTWNSPAAPPSSKAASSPQIKTQTPNPTPSLQTSPKAIKPSSPLQLPPAQIRASEEEQQKSVLVQEKPTPPIQREDSSKLSDSEDLGMRVITIAGENRGALMEITSSNTLGLGSGDDDKENSLSQPMATFFNSSVQGVNNSIVFNSSCHHNDPGIHLSLLSGNHHA